MTRKSPGSLPITKKSHSEFNWNEFISGLVETVGNFVLKGWADGGVSGITSLAKLMVSESVEEPASAKAWRLIALCFAWSLDDLKGNEELDLAKLRPIMRQALQKARDEVEEGHHQLSAEFLRNPKSASLYLTMREIVVERRAEIGIKSYYSDDDLRGKLDISFTLGVLDVWSGDPAYYGAISEHLDTPVNAAADRAIDWRRYRQRLIHDFNVSATFGQEDSGIAVSQIYISLRAYWEEEGSDARFEKNEDGQLPKSAQGVWLDEALEIFLRAKDPKDWLRLIGGGPGSGKSTTLRALAAKLAAQEGFRPLFIPLQHIGIDGDLRSAINRHFTQTSGSAFAHEPLSRSSVETGMPLVLNFDGLDELVAPNESAKETISLFVHKLTALVNDLRGETDTNLKVIVSGRMLAFQAARRLLTIPQNGALEVYGYLPASQRGLKHPNPIWDVDQRVDWWHRYATALGLDKNLPKAFSAQELASITHEPLLSYLLVLAGFSSHNWAQAAENPNRIYATLMNDIYSRGWGEASARVRSMSSREFNLLMQTIGLAAWLGGDSRVASETSFLQTLEITRARDAWQSFNDDNGPDVTNLAMNFYLKASDRSGRGFEFTHKSFGEYLAAVAILEVALAIPDVPGMRMEYVLQEWIAATGPGRFTTEILEFLRQEVRLRWQEGGSSEKGTLKDMRLSFQRMAGEVLVDGFPIGREKNWRTMERQQINAEVAVWAIINSVVRAELSSETSEIVHVEIPELERMGLRSLLQRHAISYGYSSIFTSCLTALKASDIFLSGVHIQVLDLSHCEIDHLIIEGGLLFSSTFANSKFDKISIFSSYISNSSFRNTNTNTLMIAESNMKDCGFENFQFAEMRVDEETLFSSMRTLPLDDLSRVKRFERPEENISIEENLEALSSIIGNTDVFRDRPG